MNRLHALCFLLAICLLPAAAQATLVEIASVTAPSGEGGYGSAVIDVPSGFAYFGSSTTFIVGLSTYSAITHITLSPFGTPTSLAYYSNVTNLSAAAWDSGTGYAYFASTRTPANVEVFPTAAGGFSSPTSSTTFNAGQNFIGTAVIDSVNHIAYFGTQTSPSQIIKVGIADGVSITSMTILSSMTLPSGLDNLSASIIDAQNGFAYFASSTTLGAVAKIRLSDFTLNATLTFNSGEGGVGSAVIDTTHQFGYFGTHNGPGKVIKVRLSSLTRVGVQTLNTGDDDLTSAVIDTTRGFAYFGTNTSPGSIVPIYLGDFTKKAGAALATGQDNLRSAVIDPTPGYAYFGTYTTPGQIVQMDLLAGAPDILVQPQNSTAHIGDVIILSVLADGRSLTYQWQMNGTDIAGATSAIYSRTLVAADDGALFHCVVTNSHGSATSTDALLTILPVIRAFPNPWRVDRNAGISITFEGALPNSTIKIFNLAAHWVKTLPAGVTTWNLTNDAGEMVASGYYFYLVTTQNDSQTTRGKIAVIR